MKAKKILSSILASAMILGTMSFTAFAEGTDTLLDAVYLNTNYTNAASPAATAQNIGLDSNSGTEDAPVASIAKALELVKEGGTIYITGGLPPRNNVNTAVSKPVTVEGLEVGGNYVTFQYPLPTAAGKVKYKNFNFYKQHIFGGSQSEDYSKLELEVENCTFTSGGNAAMNITRPINSLTVNECKFITEGLSKYAGQYIVWPYFAKTITITNNEFDGGDFVRGAIHLGNGHEDGTTAIIQNNKISGYERAVQIAPVNAEKITIDNNEFSNISHKVGSTKGEFEYGTVFMHENATSNSVDALSITNNKYTGCQQLLYSESADIHAIERKIIFTGNTVNTVSVSQENLSDYTRYKAAAKIGNVEYPDLHEALAYATRENAGDTTVEVLTNINLAGVNWEPIAVDGQKGVGVVTLNGNDCTISNLSAPLFSGGFAGNSGIVIKNLTIDKANINDTTNDQGIGAFINCVDSMPVINLDGCKLTNSTIMSTGGARVGGLIGWTAGYNQENDGPVDTYVTIKNCEVTDNAITASGSVGAIVGHAGNNPATYTTIENCIIKDNKTLYSTDEGGWRVGVVVGTANVGEVTINGITESGNTLTQIGKTAPDHTNLVGRCVFGDTGKLTIDGVPYDGDCNPIGVRVGENAVTSDYKTAFEQASNPADGGEKPEIQMSNANIDIKTVIPQGFMVKVNNDNKYTAYKKGQTTAETGTYQTGLTGETGNKKYDQMDIVGKYLNGGNSVSFTVMIGNDSKTVSGTVAGTAIEGNTVIGLIITDIPEGETVTVNMN